MLKITPDPPDTDNLVRPHQRHPTQTQPNIHHRPGLDTETLLAHACESLASANVMASDFAGTAGRLLSAARCWGLPRSSCWASWR